MITLSTTPHPPTNSTLLNPKIRKNKTQIKLKKKSSIISNSQIIMIINYLTNNLKSIKIYRICKIVIKGILKNPMFQIKMNYLLHLLIEIQVHYRKMKNHLKNNVPSKIKNLKIKYSSKILISKTIVNIKVILKHCLLIY